MVLLNEFPVSAATDNPELAQRPGPHEAGFARRRATPALTPRALRWPRSLLFNLKSHCCPDSCLISSHVAKLHVGMLAVTSSVEADS